MFTLSSQKGSKNRRFLEDNHHWGYSPTKKPVPLHFDKIFLSTRTQVAKVHYDQIGPSQKSIIKDFEFRRFEWKVLCVILREYLSGKKIIFEIGPEIVHLFCKHTGGHA